jgi:hypothetical protein
MAEPVQICGTKLRILGRGKNAILQQEWNIVEGGNSRYEWRDVPTVREDAGANPERVTEGEESSGAL